MHTQDSIQADSFSPNRRREEIIRLVAERGECSVDELADLFAVSGMTIRRDLHELALAGRLTRTHGGAAPASRVSFEFRFLHRQQELQSEKQAIARIAADQLEQARTIMLDSGTTTLAIARQLIDRPGLTIITTSLPIASELFGRESTELLLLGGFLRHDSPDLTGAVTETNLENLHADIAFIGADGVDEHGNVYNASPALGRMLAKMAAACQRAFIVADHTKLDSRALVRFGQLNDFAALITDDGAEPAFVDQLTRRGLSVLQPRTCMKEQPV
jgi:DeoR family transcriptional regulator of aga operon